MLQVKENKCRSRIANDCVYRIRFTISRNTNTHTPSLPCTCHTNSRVPRPVYEEVSVCVCVAGDGLSRGAKCLNLHHFFCLSPLDLSLRYTVVIVVVLFFFSPTSTTMTYAFLPSFSTAHGKQTMQPSERREMRILKCNN